uniref:G_PROTEIN_RECEP_F1_2 domain-containing protein n=1 Tax=Rhabditophanes sp. KR3021 TaxID=114890 RepID=A0AC35UD89_9BILA
MTTTTVSKFIPEGYETIKDISILKDLLIYQDIGFGLGAAGVLINIPLLFIFFSSKRYLKKNKLLAYLAIGDTLNCLGVMFQGQQRGLWYRVAMEERIVPIQTYWSCAWIPMDILGLCGALFPAITTLSMGIERLLASNFPVIYRKQFADGGTKFLIFSLAYSFITLFTALTISFINRNVKVRYYCGRKVSFSKEFLTGVYVMNVVTYCLSLILTSICLYEIIKMLNKSKGTKENRDNLLRIKSLFLLAYLAVGDLMNCLGVMFQGLQRGNMYRTAIQNQIVPIQTYWSCAWVAFDLFGLCGALLPAITTLCMGVERLLASNFPVLYRSKFANGGTLFLAFSILYSVLTVLAAFIIAFINKDVKEIA